MTQIDYKTHKLVNLEDLPNIEYRLWGCGETIENLIEYLTHLKKAADAAGAVMTRINISVGGDGYKDLEAWIPKTSEELERDRVSAEAANSATKERELKELARLKEKYETKD
jgi:hypothetical protein